MKGTSRPPCGKSLEYCLAPVTCMKLCHAFLKQRTNSKAPRPTVTLSFLLASANRSITVYCIAVSHNTITVYCIAVSHTVLLSLILYCCLSYCIAVSHTVLLSLIHKTIP